MESVEAESTLRAHKMIKRTVRTVPSMRKNKLKIPKQHIQFMFSLCVCVSECDFLPIHEYKYAQIEKAR